MVDFRCHVHSDVTHVLTAVIGILGIIIMIIYLFTKVAPKAHKDMQKSFPYLLGVFVPLATSFLLSLFSHQIVIKPHTFF